jgi:hypothetical protein
MCVPTSVSPFAVVCTYVPNFPFLIRFLSRDFVNILPEVVRNWTLMKASFVDFGVCCKEIQSAVFANVRRSL